MSIKLMKRVHAHLMELRVIIIGKILPIIKLKLVLIPQQDLVKGSEKITYYNNSPDTLKQIVLILYRI